MTHVMHEDEALPYDHTPWEVRLALVFLAACFAAVFLGMIADGKGYAWAGMFLLIARLILGTGAVVGLLGGVAALFVIPLFAFRGQSQMVRRLTVAGILGIVLGVVALLVLLLLASLSFDPPPGRW